MKKRINREIEETVKSLRSKGYTLSEIGRKLEISKSSVQKSLEKIDKREKLGELRRKEEELREKEKRLVQREREIEEKERRSDEKIAKIFRDAEFELKKTKEKKEEYEGRIGEIKKREKEANKLFDLLGESKLTLQDVVDATQNYNSYTEETKSLKNAIPSLREEYERDKRSRDEMRSELSKVQKELVSNRNEIYLMRKEISSLNYAVGSLQERKDVLTYQVANLEARAKYLDENYEEEFERRKLDLENIKSETDGQKSRLNGLKDNYERIKKDHDDLLSSGKDRIDENIKSYREEELSKLEKEFEEKKAEIDREIELKEAESKKLDEIISSKREEYNALIEQVNELTDICLDLRERIIMNSKRCDSLEDEREFRKILMDIGKIFASITEPKQPLLLEPDALADVRKIVLDKLREKGIAIPADLKRYDHQPALSFKTANSGIPPKSASVDVAQPVLFAQSMPKTAIAQPMQTPKEVSQDIHSEGKRITEFEERNREAQKGKSKERMGSSKKSRRSQRMAERKSGLAGEGWYPTRICPLLA